MYKLIVFRTSGQEVYYVKDTSEIGNIIYRIKDYKGSFVSFVEEEEKCTQKKLVKEKKEN